MHATRNHGTSLTALLVALAVLALIGQQLGFLKMSTAQAAIETGISVTISSKASGTHTFTAANNSTPSNDVLVLPGEQVTLNINASMPATSDRVHFREDGSALSADLVSGSAPIIWGWNPAAQSYALGIFPQDTNGNDLSSPIWIDVFSINPMLSATPNIVAANGPAVTIQPSWTPMATTKFVFNPGYGPDLAATSNAGATVTFTVPGDYQPSVKFLNAANEIIATATANTVFVNTNVTITPANSTQQQGSLATFTVPELQNFWSMTVPPANLSVIWTLPNGTQFDSALATRNGDQARADQLNWWVDQSGVIGVSIEVNGIEVGTNATNVTMQNTPDPDPVKVPSYTASPDAVWTAGMTSTLSIFITNPPTNINNLALRISAPGYSEYNAWAGAPHIAMPDGRVRLDVLYNFPEVGQKTFNISLDYVDGNSVWQHLTPTTATITVLPQASGEITGGKHSYFVSEPIDLTLVLHDLTLQPGDNVLWVGPWGEANTGAETNPLRLAKYQTTPWHGNIVVRVERNGKNLVTAYLNDVTAGQMHSLYLPLTATAPAQVTINGSTAAPQKGIEFQLTANYPVGGEAHFTWNFNDGRQPYDSTVGHQRGEQPADNIVKFTPGEARHYIVTLEVTKPVNGTWQTVGTGTYEFDAK